MIIKKYYVKLSLILIAVILSSCNNTECDNYTHSDKNIYPMEVDANLEETEYPIIVNIETVDRFGASLLFENVSERDLSYGVPFELYIWESASCTWNELQMIDRIVFAMPAFSLKSNETATVFRNWLFIYGELTPGLYKIKHEFSYERIFDSYGAPLPRKNFDVYTEFRIEPRSYEK